MSSKCISSTNPWFGKGHVLIRTPFSELRNVQFITETSTTGSSPGFPPRLPTLIPCPGPQVIPLILMLRLPCPIEMQSSPVLMMESLILMLLLKPRWIPSVLGLLSGAVIVTRSKVILVQPKSPIWKCLLSKLVTSLTKLLLTLLNFMLCTKSYHHQYLNRSI